MNDFIWESIEPVLLPADKSGDLYRHNQQVKCVCGNTKFQLFSSDGWYQLTGRCTKCKNTATVYSG